MIRRVSHLTLALAAVAALLSPAALAGGSKPKKHHKGLGNCTSAVCVYSEPNPSLNGLPGGNGPPVPLSPHAQANLDRRGGQQKRTLQTLGTSRFLGVRPPLTGQSPLVGRVNAPGAFLAALDLGPGPIALFVTLLAGAAAFAVGRALRHRRNAA